MTGSRKKLSTIFLFSGLGLQLAVAIWLLTLDKQVIENGKIGFLTLMVYYAATIIGIIISFIGYRGSHAPLIVKTVVGILWVGLISAPQFLTIYGYEGP
ncbi:hypothetical protein [Alteromonas sp. H39]|uniref:hypothetical protein n=1 Tax=Alteromonas sp. H39 TaxID=3389876 RepID=UPI0039DFCA30